MTYTSVLFDFDGTLGPTLPFWVEAFRLVFRRFGQSLTDDEIVGRCFYRDFDEIASDFGLPSAAVLRDEITEALWECFDEFELFSGAANTLHFCVENNIKLALVTSSPRRIVERALARVGIAAHFQVLVTADDTRRLKPDPEPVLRALSLLNADAHETLFVGDSPVDMIAGHAAKTKTALFCPKTNEEFHNYQDLLNTQPHFVFNEYPQLSHYLDDSLEPLCRIT